MSSGPNRPGAPRSFPDPVPQVLPFGSLSILAGAPGCGKTTLVVDLLARLRDGRTFCRLPTHVPTKIAIISSDRRWQSHQRWFSLAGFPDIPHISLRDMPGMNWENLRLAETRRRLLIQCLDRLELPPGSFLVLDPLATWLPTKLSDYHSMIIGLGSLDSEVFRSRLITVLGIGHMSKQKANVGDRWLRPQDRLLGSTALVGFSDTLLYLLAPEECDHEWYELGWCPHNDPPGTFQFERSANGLFVPYAGREETEFGVMQQLRDLLPEDGLTAGAWCAAAKENFGLPERTFYRYYKRLRELQRVTVTSDGIIYRRKPS